MDEEAIRFRPTSCGGQYESYYIRGNHRERPLAFWLRYTLFSARHRAQEAYGELWAVVFDGESGRNSLLKKRFVFAECKLLSRPLRLRLGGSLLESRRLTGEIESAGAFARWSIESPGETKPVFLYPQALYSLPIPRSKVLVMRPNVSFSGTVEVAERTLSVNGFRGSHNHTWGPKHPSYAWGQVNGFDNAPESFLEVATSSVEIGHWKTPPLTPIVLHHAGLRFLLNGIRQVFVAVGSYDFFHWKFASETRAVSISGKIAATASDFVALRYADPPGGEKWCINSKIAHCELDVRWRDDSGKWKEEHLLSRCGAAFEILTERDDHGVAQTA